MTKFFSKYKIIFYLTNFLLIILYIFPGSLLGCVFLNDCTIQPQITSDLIISTNHLYAFAFISIIADKVIKSGSNRLKTKYGME